MTLNFYFGSAENCLLTSPCSSLSLRIEVHRCHGLSEAVLSGETARAEVVPGRRRDHLCEAALLLEDHEHVSVDAYIGPWHVVLHNLSSCSIKSKQE